MTPHGPHTAPESASGASTPLVGPAVAPPADLSSRAVRVITPAGEPVRPFANPVRVAIHLWRLRYLTLQLTRRDLAARYRGSFLGTFWTLLVPLFTLAVYTFVFSLVFRARWGVQPDEGHGLFALTLFAGLIPFNVFSEILSTAPGVVLANPGYVKRIIFPLEILPLVRVLGALVQGFASGVILVLGLLVLRGRLEPSLLLMPLTWLPLLLVALGAAYVLAALGVFVRDIGQAVIVLLPFLFFLSPIVYPADAVPPQFRAVTYYNPIAHVVEDCRRTAIFGLGPDWKWFFRTLVLGGLLSFGGFLFFMKCRRAFNESL